MPYIPYYPGGWDDSPNTSTPIIAAALNTIEAGIGAASGMPTPTAANQYPVSNGSDQWTLAQAGTIGGNSYSSGWTLGASDLGGEALYSSSSPGTVTIPSNLTSIVGESFATRQLSSGSVTIAGAGGVTVEGTLTTSGQYQTLFARQVSANVWAVTASQTGNAATATNLAGGATFPDYVAPKVITLTDGSSVALNAALGNTFAWPLGGASHTLAVPSNPADGQAIKIRIKYGGSFTPLFNAVFDFGAGGQPSWTATSGKTDIAGFEYDAALNGGAGEWAYLGSVLGLTS